MSDLSGQRVALIGGAGFIGHNLALELKRRGAEVAAIDGLEVNHLVHYAARRRTRNRDLYIKILLERLKLLRERRHPARCARTLATTTACHMRSASSSPRRSCIWPRWPTPTARTRTRSRPSTTPCARWRTRSTGRAARTCSASSSSPARWSTATSETEEITEEHPLNPIGIYGALKLGGEKLVIAYNQVFDLPYTILRPSALYGPRCVSRRVEPGVHRERARGQHPPRGRRGRRSGWTSPTSTTWSTA